MDYSYKHYENWTNEVPYGWQPELTLNRNVISMNHYYEIIDWINENIKNPKQNVHWTLALWPTFRFRKAKDQMWFMLRWS